jgi:outer membrane lipoprotein carrier protein
MKKVMYESLGYGSRIYQVFLILCCLSISSAYAEQHPFQQLKSFLASTRSLTANFKQVTLDENNRAIQSSEGLFYLSRPGKFRWSYQTPYIQEIVSAQGKVYFYDADLEQVTIKNMDDSFGSTPALLLSGEIALEANFSLQEQGIDEGLQWIKLTPKKDESGFNYILIGLDNGSIGGMELSDNFGQLTRIYFSNVKKNISIEKQIFEFSVPAGVDVFEN